MGYLFSFFFNTILQKKIVIFSRIQTRIIWIDHLTTTTATKLESLHIDRLFVLSYTVFTKLDNLH